MALSCPPPPGGFIALYTWCANPSFLWEKKNALSGLLCSSGSQSEPRRPLLLSDPPTIIRALGATGWLRARSPVQSSASLRGGREGALRGREGSGEFCFCFFFPLRPARFHPVKSIIKFLEFFRHRSREHFSSQAL